MSSPCRRIFFYVSRNDDEERSDGNEGKMDEVDNSDLDYNLAASESDQQTRASAASLVYDRPKKFIIEDTGNSGPAVFSAKKSLSVSRVRGATRSMVTAVAVRERGTEKFDKVIRFLLSVPSSMGAAIDSWVAVPHIYSSSSYLLSKRDNEGKLVIQNADAVTLKEKVERILWDNCKILSIAQRCADWFIMRQFRVTGTNASKIICRDENVREKFHLPFSSNQNNQSAQELLASLARGWFSSCRSTESMKRGTANESADLNAWTKKDICEAVYEVGMFGLRYCDWIACSPDGVAVLVKSKLQYQSTIMSQFSEREPILASVEIKTGIADSTLQRFVNQSSSDVMFYDCEDPQFPGLLPEEHWFQVLQQVIVLKVHFGISVTASETVLLRVLVIYCSSATKNCCLNSLKSVVSPAVQGAHGENTTPPLYADNESKNLIKAHLPFWKIINSYVKHQSEFPPIRLFKHGSQTFYSKNKGGVDGSAQARAILRSPTSNLAWEQKVVTQTLKTLFVNSFITWRMFEKRQLLQDKVSFGTLDRYRHSLSTVQSLADFSFDCCRELLAHAETLNAEIERQGGGRDRQESSDDVVNDRELARIRVLASNRKRNRIPFFNSHDGKRLSLSERRHEQIR